MELVQDTLQKVIKQENLSTEEAYQFMLSIMNGELTPAQIAAYIIALRIKGETVEEITGSAKAMREKSIRIQPAVPFSVDTCGTGGDGTHTFNISTTAALVAAAAGLPVAKHGNRSVSSACGSADILAELGVRIDLEPERVCRSIEENNFGFMFAPLFHPAMKYAIGPRKEIGVRTVFNILGPLTNPAGAGYQLLGVYSPDLLRVMASVLGALGSKRVWVVYGENGQDEISISSPTRVVEWYNGQLTSFEIFPEELGLDLAPLSSLQVKNVEESAKLVLSVLKGNPGPARNAVCLNTAAIFAITGKTKDLKEGLELANEIIDSGKAWQVLENLKKFPSI